MKNSVVLKDFILTRNLVIAILTGAMLAVVLTQSSLAFIDLAAQYLTDTSFDSSIFLGGAFFISFFLAVAMGWFTSLPTQSKRVVTRMGLVTPLLAFLTYLTLESFFRMARLSRLPALDTLIKIWSVLDLYLMLAAAFAGIFFGYLIGAKARREDHYIRLYIFTAFFALILISAALIHGIETFNPLSNTRGVL